MKNYQNGFIGIALIILGLLIVGGGAYYVGKHTTEVSNNATSTDRNEESKLVNGNTNSTGTTFGFLTNVGDQAEDFGIKLTAPNGGETFEIGSVMHITWVADDSQSPVTMDLIDPRGNSVFSIGRQSNTGMFDWTIPASVQPSSAYRLIIDQESKGSPMAEGPHSRSRGYFTIILPNQTFSPTRITSVKDINNNVINSTPHVDMIDQSPVVQIYGSGFTSSSVVHWEPGQDFPINEEVLDVSADGIKLSTKVPSWLLKPGTYQISVLGPGRPENVFDFTITSPVK